MFCKINIKFVEKVDEDGKWVKVILTNGVIVEDLAKNFDFSYPFIIHY